ncbi:hypothetical protein N9383_03705 [Granulosicoccus sp.]|nr:hypothetical protein [Granulosicoccus sp.]
MPPRNQNLAGLDHQRPVGSVVYATPWCWWHEGDDHVGTVGVRNIDDADSRVLIGGEDRLVTRHPIRPDLIQIVWNDLRALGDT